MTSLGQALTATFEDFGIAGHIFACDADATEITVWRSVQTSDGKGVAMFQDSETGEINEVARVAETFHLHRRTR